MIHRVLRPPRPDIRPCTFGVRAVLLSLVLGTWALSCTPVGMPTTQPGPVGQPIPSIQEGHLPSALAREAERALNTARDALADGRWGEARDVARQVIDYYPGAAGSGEALTIFGEAALELGEPAEALEAVDRYLALVDPFHPTYVRAVYLRSRALFAGGEAASALEGLLLVPPDAPAEDMEAISDLLLDISATVPAQEIRRFLERLDPSHPFRGVLEGNVGGAVGAPAVLGAILPRSGASPGLMEYAEWVLEGIQVAIDEFQQDLGRPIHLEALDLEGDPDGARSLVRRLEDLGAVGVVGPLTQGVLAQASEARTEELPLISPFSFLSGGEDSGVLSLSGPDPGGAEAVARYAWDLGLERVAVLRPGTEEAQVEASVFQRAFRDVGGSVPREIVYDSGATFFQAEFEAVGSIWPDGLFLPLPSRDIQLLAPQFTYYGLDTLGIQLLGTTGWTEDEVVQEVDSRHTDGVIASTTRISQDETEAFREFRLRYETLFQKSLRSQIPAYGYDAAALFLQALRSNPRTHSELLQAMETIEDFPGATGRLTVREGRILRRPLLVRIQDHELIYISSRFD